jgi:hypothetical protein
MMEKSDPKAEDAAEPVVSDSQETKKKRVRGYISYLDGGEGTLALKSKLTKIGKDLASDIVVKGWTIGKTAATISRTRDGYFFSYVDGFSKPKINNKKVSKKPHKLTDSDIIDIGAVKLQFINKKRKKSAVH